MATILTRAGKASALAASEYDDALKRETNPQVGNYTIAATDNRSTVTYTGSGATFSLPDLSTLLAAEDTGDFTVTIKHCGTGTLTIDPAASNYIDTVEQNISLAPKEAITLKGATGDDWLIVNRSNPDGTEGYIMRMGAINPTWGQTIIQGTADSAATQTYSDFTDIPSWATQVTVNILALSTNGTSVPRIQLGTGGVASATGYSGSVMTHVVSGNTTDNLSTGFDFAQSWSAASIATGSYVLTLVTGTTWVCNGGIGFANTAALATTRGYKSLTGALDKVRVIMDGTDVFDGSTYINISYC